MNRVAHLRTLASLGWGNLARVGLYRVGLRARVHPAQRLRARAPEAPFFAPVQGAAKAPKANTAWSGMLRWYDWKSVPHDDTPPDWFAHPFGPRWQGDAGSQWWRIGDFSGGDIKNVWELSRFGWAPAFATLAANGDGSAVARLNAWIGSWCEANPPYRGPNWKCGQEASIRLINTLAAALVLDQDQAPEPGLAQFVRMHLQRIAPTVSYAIGQQNNHATSEAAALFAGGEFLKQCRDADGAQWAATGRELLENRAQRLIEADGSFSQYSITYHRLMLDAYAFSEAWRRRRNLPALSAATVERLRAATGWLDAMIERISGDAPNLGANDGARLIPLTDSDYRDFRPTIQLASALFRGTRAIEKPGRWDDQLRWLGVALPAQVESAPVSRSFDNGGFHVLRAGRALALLHYPRFRFRPSQADALHVDLWVGPINLLRDGGSFSYNDGEGIGTFLAGTAAHNTVQFDGRDQMPRVGRFLFGEWLRASDVEPVTLAAGRITAGAGYRDSFGARHHRRITLGEGEGEFACIDTIDGHFASAVLRWRLRPGEYRLDNSTLRGDGFELTVSGTGAPARLSLSSAPESLYYQCATDIPVLEVTCEGPAVLVTTLRFNASAIADAA